MQPYYNSAVASGLSNLLSYYFFYPMMPPYGPPYSALYLPGGVYAHLPVPIVSLHSTVCWTPLSMETPRNHQEILIRVKEEISVGNGHAESAESVEMKNLCLTN
ncbi:hypothetical protein VNO78_18576 [Psophocarpus tetragonolobus]|uniref:Uncharacterized protein n=1 Tax=Psophocarpus tetragonolobus TaxID=3891 RepID=A0AAN9SL56_PSOTE